MRIASAADIQGIAHVHVDSWKSTYKGIISNEYLASLDTEKRAESWEKILNNGKSITYVAESETGEIVGFASGGQEQTGDPIYMGEVYAIYILESHQRKGLGKKLIKPVIAELINRKFPNLVIWALEENGCRSFYESLGGKIVNKKPILISGSSLIEVAYGWDNIQEAL
ncbi:GNAT family N-acetyltransferase [Peribacillus cavernae]|uniref:GNAT family N-acetyltransferase n=1 Tax=Peribacillus cavernae TaxID=1674310 RepID=A0A3S0VHV9_9BACI|nr:GNAT family N-acetyltransferase [Peribacillus cavernae]